MALEEYRHKRDLGKTGEPYPGKVEARNEQLSYLIQKHDATRLHYDFTLELDGVLLSWAVTKGPSLNPPDKQLAVRTEDHPLAYGCFEGREYGGGTVMLWDRGTWVPKGYPHTGLKKGHLAFELHGERLKGGWNLVRMRGDAKRAKIFNAYFRKRKNVDEVFAGKVTVFVPLLSTGTLLTTAQGAPGRVALLSRM